MLAAVVTAMPAVSQDDVEPASVPGERLPSSIWLTRPVRRDEPLRFENINDLEVGEIRSLMAERYPGAIVYISGVTLGCACQDGPQCTEQVWSAALLGDDSYELLLSRIDGTWQVGPLQEWGIARDRLFELAFPTDPTQERIPYDDFQRRLLDLERAYPWCASVDTLAAPAR